MSKWDYIKLLSKYDPNDKYDYILCDLMDACHKNNLSSITLEEARAFYAGLYHERKQNTIF